MNVPLTDTLLVALANLVDDAQSETRRPSHSDLRFAFERAGLLPGDPAVQGQSVGKAKRVASTLSWAMEHAPRDSGALHPGLDSDDSWIRGFSRGFAQLCRPSSNRKRDKRIRGRRF
jgi:hypothetical protein